jgi:hypothetical protein
LSRICAPRSSSVLPAHHNRGHAVCGTAPLLWRGTDHKGCFHERTSVHHKRGVRKSPSWPRGWANFSPLGQLQPFIAVFPQECMGQLAYFGSTWRLSRVRRSADREDVAEPLLGERSQLRVGSHLHARCAPPLAITIVTRYCDEVQRRGARNARFVVTSDASSARTASCTRAGAR